ncbi:methyl-accepting chemotaxis protein [Oceanobacillus bengalensis]|uniref:Methyl-accepting chemotaxis protein n=1 Tax=Oceanobacillus bengalensis TaxID=1435466 RepID=A0A494YUK7_9BACI|nr:methyl-accepting chemotaxis protein [Oceanobacillus bengalensis]RKQ13785.1 methyl-accepting chemotaxis protein [Oceanobacillus bengalensis]
MKIKNFKIGTKINLLVIAIILFLSSIIALVSFFQVKKAMEEVFTDRVQVVSGLGYNWLDETYKGEWEIKDGELYKGNVKMNDNNEIMDKIGELTNGAATIFQGDTRIATNVMQDGQRTIGTKADPDVTEAVLKNQETFIGEADIVGENHLTMYKPLKSKDGEVVGMWLVGPKINVINNTILSLLSILFIVIVVSGAIAIIGSIIFTKSIVRPIININDQLKDISDGEGDLTKELSVNTKDEVGELAGSFNRMIRSLRDMIGQVGTTSNQVAAASEELTASAEQTSEATNEIASSIQEVASGADIQEQSANESLVAMREMAIGIQQVAETSSSVSDLATETNKEANDGNELIQKAVQQMNAINTATETTSTVIKRLGDQSDKIGNIIEVITGISEQTNLLALNAAIESARAGEHGKGFAVVADEVRKLAEQSKDSADQIAKLIQQIQADTTHAVHLMDKGTEEASLGLHVIHQTGDGFSKILQSIEKVTSQIQEVSAVSEEMSASAEQVNASMEEISRISKTSADNTQNVASASEEQLASMEEITSSATHLSKMAEELQMLVGRFKL